MLAPYETSERDFKNEMVLGYDKLDTSVMSYKSKQQNERLRKGSHERNIIDVILRKCNDKVLYYQFHVIS